MGAGRWEEMEQLAAELLAEREDRAGAESIHHRPGPPGGPQGSSRGRPGAEHLRTWEGTDNEEIADTSESAALSVAVAAGNTEHALQLGAANALARSQIAWRIP